MQRLFCLMIERECMIQTVRIPAGCANMEDGSFRTLKSALDALQHSNGSLGSALAEILSKYGDDMTVEQKMQIANAIKKNEIARKIDDELIIWENDWF